MGVAGSAGGAVGGEAVAVAVAGCAVAVVVVVGTAVVGVAVAVAAAVAVAGALVGVAWLTGAAVCVAVAAGGWVSVGDGAASVAGGGVADGCSVGVCDSSVAVAVAPPPSAVGRGVAGAGCDAGTQRVAITITTPRVMANRAERANRKRIIYLSSRYASRTTVPPSIDRA